MPTLQNGGFSLVGFEGIARFSLCQVVDASFTTARFDLFLASA